MSAFFNFTIDQKKLNALLLLCVLSTIVLVFIATSAGLRGTDQYQYAADAETIRSHQPPLTNLFYPAKIVRNQAVQNDTNFFSHNGPLLHIVANSARGIDIQTTWIVLNCLFHLFTAITIFILARSHTSLSIATIVTALYFSSPIAFWQTSNVLQEMFFGALVALCLLCYYFRKNPVAIVLLPICYFIGALSHPIFILAGLLHGLSLVIFALFKDRDYKLLLGGIATLATIYSALALSANWFPSQFQPNLKEIITSAIPNYSNMVYHFQVVTPDISVGLLLEKLIAAVNMQFISVRNAPFFIFTNIAGFGLLYLLYGCLIRRSFSLYQIAPLAVLFGAYIGMIVLQQNHARFQQIISPATFVIIALLIHRININVVKPLMLVVCLSIAVDAVYAQHLRKQAILQKSALSEITDQVEELTNGEGFVAVNILEHGALAYALRPKKLLTIRPNLMTNESIKSATESFDHQYVLMKGEHESLFTKELNLVTDYNNAHFGKLKIYSY